MKPLCYSALAGVLLFTAAPSYAQTQQLSKQQLQEAANACLRHRTREHKPPPDDPKALTWEEYPAEYKDCPGVVEAFMTVHRAEKAALAAQAEKDATQADKDAMARVRATAGAIKSGAPLPLPPR